MRPVRLLQQHGITLVELMVVVLVFLPALLATILIFIRCVDAIELSRNISRAVYECQNQISLIETTPFAQITGTYHNEPFLSQTLNGRGASYVETIESDLLRVTVSMSWIEKNGRTIGEDLDFDGAIDVGEDVNGNGMLDSPVRLVTLIYDL